MQQSRVIGRVANLPDPSVPETSKQPRGAGVLRGLLVSHSLTTDCMGAALSGGEDFSCWVRVGSSS